MQWVITGQLVALGLVIPITALGNRPRRGQAPLDALDRPVRLRRCGKLLVQAWLKRNSGRLEMVSRPLKLEVQAAERRDLIAAGEHPLFKPRRSSGLRRSSATG